MWCFVTPNTIRCNKTDESSPWNFSRTLMVKDKDFMYISHRGLVLEDPWGRELSSIITLLTIKLSTYQIADDIQNKTETSEILLMRRLWIFECSDFYRAMHFSAKRGIAITCRLSVCLSVRPSVTLVNCDRIGWKSSKIISPSVSLVCSLFATQTSRVYSKGNTLKFSPE